MKTKPTTTTTTARRALLLLAAAFLILHSTFFISRAAAQKRPELAPTPFMGWNSWNWYGPKITEKEVVETIDAMAATGLRDAGYVYIIVDGGWREDFLDADGRLLSSADRFPKGIKWLAEYAHSKGFKFGLHTVPGCCDCRGNEMGSYGREKTHLAQFLDWKLDFIKLDQCKFTKTGKGGGWPPAKIREVYAKWSKLLRESGRDIALSASNYAFKDWYPELTNMGRTTGDIRCRWNSKAQFDNEKSTGTPAGLKSVMEIADINNKHAASAGNGYWNDAEMLALGDQGLTDEEQKIHFALWCVMTAPLFLGNDPRHMTPQELALISNKEIIAINQDPTEQGVRLSAENGVEVWQKKLKNGDRALLILNRKNTPGETTVNFEKLGLPNTLRVRDLYAKKDLGAQETLTAKFPARGSMFVRVSK